MEEAPLAWTHPERVVSAVRQEFQARRREVTERAAEIVRTRVSQFGVGPDGQAVAGYSSNPLAVSQYSGLKPKRRPRGAQSTRKLANRNNWVGFYPGGYKEYRAASGLRTDGFFFSNFGTAWRHWGDVGTQSIRRSRHGFVWSAGIGFRRLEDQIAAGEAQQKRPALFQIGPVEALIFLQDTLVPIFNNAFRKFYTVSGTAPVGLTLRKGRSRA